MAALTTIALVVGATAAVAGTAYSIQQGRKQAKASRRAMQAEQRRAGIQNARERRGMIRNARVARASVESQAALSGLMGSSAAAASQSNIQGRLGENLSFLDQNMMLSQQASAANEAAARYASRAAVGQGVANLGMQVASTYGGPTPQGTA